MTQAQVLSGAEALLRSAKALPIGIASIDALLPEGVPRSAVVELCSPGGHARITRFALSLCRAEQERHQEGWCAWIDPSGSLFAPGACEAGLDLERLLVVRPEPEDLARVAVRIANSRAFGVIVVDRLFTKLPPRTQRTTQAARQKAARQKAARQKAARQKAARQKTRWSTVTRRLALAVENCSTTVVILNTTQQSKSESLPVAMRIQLSRRERDRITFHVNKDRRGQPRPPLHLPISAFV